MAGNTRLGEAKSAKNDEFYTRFCDIEAEMNAYYEYNNDVFRDKTILLPCDDPEWSEFTRYFAVNFERFGLKKLISTSYARGAGNKHLTPLELASPLFSEDKHLTHGKLFTLTHDSNGSGNINIDDIEFSEYLEGDGDFRSAEITKLRDEADIIITNPPFSLFREFLAWVVEANKQFIIMGNKNAITYKGVFPLLKNNEMWVGYTSLNGGRWMILPKDIEVQSSKAKSDSDGNMILNIAGVCWFTNIEHGKRHEFLKLDTMEHNLVFNKKLKKRLLDDFGINEYPRYENYDALEVPLVEAIPSDYDGILGVPRTFLDVYNPDQFEIVGRDGDLDWAENECDFYTPPSSEKQKEYKRQNKTWRVQNSYVLKDGKPETIYARLFIRPKKRTNAH